VEVIMGEKFTDIVVQFKEQLKKEVNSEIQTGEAMRGIVS
jgi:hypothetical protein